MTLSMFQASVPIFIQALGNLAHILEKGAAHAKARNIEPAVFLNDRLAPDMFPLTRQVQLACDGPMRGAARLAGMEIPITPDTETSFEELQARIAYAVSYLKGFTAAQIDGSEARAITFRQRSGERHFQGQDFLLGFVLPNLHFHIATAYLILRHNGVDVGKSDFLGNR